MHHAIVTLCAKFDAPYHHFMDVYEHLEEAGTDISDEEFLKWVEDVITSGDTMDTVPRAWMSGVLHGFINARR